MTDEPTTTDETQGDAAAEPQEQLSPKERRRRARAQRSASPRPRTPEERAAARQRRKEARRRWRLRQRERARAARGDETGPAEQAPVVESTGRRRVRQGVVVSAKPDKTIAVRIDVARRHRRYEKVVRESTTLHAHDEGNEAREGDTVRVVESRPLSRTKRWRLVEILERAR